MYIPIMPTSLFQTSTHAKCILAGEHAVLRGSPAIIFPLKNRSLELVYQADNNSLHADFNAPHGETLLSLFWDTLQTSTELLGIGWQKITGKFLLTNNIPMGSGMGFSSALCVTIAKWLVWNNFLKNDRLFSFAKRLEDNFHGKSSGVDIAGVLADNGIMYSKKQGIKKLLLNWQPCFFISPTESSSSTAKCIQQVEELWKKDKSLAKQTDMDMKKSVQLIKKALAMNSTKGLKILAEAIQKANHCFAQWHLITPELQKHMDFLLDRGAVAVKPTGSGAGGYVLSLWEKPPNLNIEMIPVF